MKEALGDLELYRASQHGLAGKLLSKRALACLGSVDAPISGVV